MAVETTNNRIAYAGNGSTTGFSFPYKFLANGDLKIYIRVDSTGVETLKTITTHYTVTGAGEDAGGTVTMLTAPASGETLIIYNDPAATQGVDLVENDSSPAEVNEGALDRLTLLVQRLINRVDRCVRLTDAFSPSFTMTLPSNLNEAANKVPVINSDGNGFADCDEWPSTTDLEDAEENAAAAAASAADAASEADDAADSAAAAAATAAAITAVLPFRDVVYKTSADSPLTISASDVGKVFHLNCASGAIAVNLPSIAALTGDQKGIFLVKSDSGSNKVTYTRNGTDTIEGATSGTLDSQGQGVILVGDTEGSPDDWTKLSFATAGGGGGVDIDFFTQADSPVEQALYNSMVYEFEDTLSQYLYAEFVVPDNYILGNPISLKGQFFAPATAGDVLFKTVSTLIRAGTDASSSTTNQRTSTNSAVTLSGSNDIDRAFTCDLTSTTGTINSVAVSPRDRIKFRIERDTATDTAAASAYLYKKGYEVTLR